MKRIALLMIVLMLSIPMVVAQELSVTKFSGEDEVFGFARAEDNLTIEARMSIPGEDVIDAVTQTRITLRGVSAPFDSCADQGGGVHNCAFETSLVSWGQENFTFELLDDDLNVRETAMETLTIDAFPPGNVSLVVDPQITKGSVTITYSAQDYGVSYGQASDCAGVKHVKFSVNGSEFHTEGAQPGTCSVLGNFPHTFTSSGTFDVCAVATDYMGRESAPECTTVTVDAEPPMIANFSVYDPNTGFHITHIRSGVETEAEASVRITDNVEVDSESVQANFGQLTGGADFIPYDEREAADLSVFTWTELPLSEATTCQVVVQASDTFENAAQETFDCSIRVDDTAPELIGLVVNATKDGVPLFGITAPIKIALSEKDNVGLQGSGFDRRQVFLDLSDMDLGSHVQADQCYYVSATRWECTWNIPGTVSERVFEVELKEVVDDLDNAFSANQVFNVSFDNEGPDEPQIMSVEVISAETGPRTSGSAIRGEYAKYTVRSGGFNYSFANFSDLHPNGGHVLPTECTPAGDQWDCVFESLIDFDGPYTANVSFRFEDEARNFASTWTTLTVFGVETTTPNYWTLFEPECTPEVVDRSTTSLVPQYVSCRIKLHSPQLQPGGPDAISTLAVAGPTSPADCSGNTVGFVNDLYMFNNGEDSIDPYIMLKLEPADFYVNQLNISCPIRILSKRVGENSSVYVSTNAEEETVNLTVKFFDQPMGALAENTIKVVEDAIDNDFFTSDFLNTLHEFQGIAEKACYLRGLLSNLVNTFFVLTNVFGTAEIALKSNPLTAPAGVSMSPVRQGFCETEETTANLWKEIDNTLGEVCSFVNCRATSDLTGGTPWCKEISAAWGTWEDLDSPFGLHTEGPEQLRGAQNLQVKESIVWSLGCLCLPGIIYNLEKIRQLTCFKGVCYYDYVQEYGYPTAFCDDMSDRLWCQYAWGEVWNFLPWVQTIDKIANFVLDMVSNPINLVPAAVGAYCYSICPKPAEVSMGEFIFCAGAKTLAILTESAVAVKQMSDAGADYWEPVGNQYCERLTEIKEEIEGDEA